MENEKKSSAILPIVQPNYPEVKWAYTDFFGYVMNKAGFSDVDPTTRFNKNNEVVEDESKWRNYSIHIKPQQRFEAAYKQGKLQLPAGIKVSAARANSSSEIFNTIDTRVVFHIKELPYPGDTAIDVVEKWIYAIHTDSKQVLAEVFAEKANSWLFRYNPDFPQNTSIPMPENRCDGKLELPMINASESGTIIGFYVSPFRLTHEGIKYLTEDGERLKAACVRPIREDSERLFAAVPDPYQWAVDAHEKYYIPLLDEWQAYIFDPKRQAKLFIASTVKAWIETVDKGFVFDTKDPLDIEDELKPNEPDKTINQYKHEEEKLSIKAEKAAAYLAHCVYSPEHRAAEKAALEAKDYSLTLTFQNWAIVVERATESAQGRKFAISAFNDTDRLPNKYIFSKEDIPPLSELLKKHFPNGRYAWQAAYAIAGELFPAIITDLTEKNVRRQIYENMIKYLERLNVEAWLKEVGTNVSPGEMNLEKFWQPEVPKGIPLYIQDKAGKTLYQQLKQNKNLAEGAMSKRTVKRVEMLYKKIIEETDVATIPNGLKDSTLDAMNKRYGKESFIGKHRLKIAFVSESINVMLAISEFSDSNRQLNWKNDKFVSLLGSSADFSSVFFQPVFEKFGLEKATLPKIIPKIGGKEILLGKALGGVAGIVGGICQMTDEQRQAVEGVTQYDFGIGVGHGIAAAGAAMTAVGGALVLAEAVGWGAAAGGPFGAAIGAIGAGLIIGGNLLAVWLKDKPHEQFARFCFLGKQYDTVAHQVYELNEKLNDYNLITKFAGRQPYVRTPLYTEWSNEGGIPTDDILKEARLLIWLLSSFKMELETEGAGNPMKGNNFNPEAYIKILPGYLPPSAKIEIKIEQEYIPRNGADFPEKFEATLLFDQMTDEIVFMHGSLVPFMKHNVVKRDKFGNVEYIKFAIRPDQVKFHGTMSFDQYLNYQGLARSCKSSFVKAQIAMERVYQPSAAKYLQLNTLEEDKVNTDDTSKWS